MIHLKRQKFHNKVADMLLEFEDEIERNNYLESVCRTFNIPLDGLRQLVKKKGLNYIGKKQREEKETIKSGNKEKEEAVVLAQQILLTWLIEEKIFLNVLQSMFRLQIFLMIFIKEWQAFFGHRWKKMKQILQK